MRLALTRLCFEILLATLLLPLVSRSAYADEPSEYLVGTGIYDITGPAAEIGMMGFAEAKQTTAGIHTRLRSRAFIAGDSAKRIVFVTADLGMLFQMIKLKVVERVQANPELAPFYNMKNITLTATHTHGGPGGYSGYFLYDATIKGFIKPHFEAIVNGIYQSILRAHNNLQPGHIQVGESQLDGVGGSRAKEAYGNNPESEISRYDADTDKSFTQLKFVTKDGRPIGILNWFAVHPDSIGPTNQLITGDNKGIAAYMFERDMGTNYFAENTFVAGFAQANEGDVTPNYGFGQAPPDLDFAHNKSLANATLGQYNKAKELFASSNEYIAGTIDYRHEWIDMRELYVESAGVKTCAAGMGASFSSGSPLDNPSPAPLFPMGTTVNSLTWEENQDSADLSKLLGGVFSVVWPTTGKDAYKNCHGQKPVLIPTGIAHLNFNGTTMTPQIMPVQLIKLGSLAIIAVPAEVTTMAGRRMKEAVLAELSSEGVRNVVVSSLANSYASYLTTREEYQKQWYEGAATLFGPNEEEGFRQEYRKLAQAIVSGSQVADGPTPPDVTKGAVDFSSKVLLDTAPFGKTFGDVKTQPNPSYSAGDEITVQFWGAHPNNNYRTQDSFLVIEKFNNGIWEDFTFDGDPATTYRWARDGIANSIVTITWSTQGVAPGRYRIRHKGDAKTAFSGKKSYEGLSAPFEID